MNLMVVDASALVAYVRSHDDWSPVANRILEAHFAAGGGIRIPNTVSYTHLDVYKRQALGG